MGIVVLAILEAHGVSVPSSLLVLSFALLGVSVLMLAGIADRYVAYKKMAKNRAELDCTAVNSYCGGNINVIKENVRKTYRENKFGYFVCEKRLYFLSSYKIFYYIRLVSDENRSFEDVLEQELIRTEERAYSRTDAYVYLTIVEKETVCEKDKQDLHEVAAAYLSLERSVPSVSDVKAACVPILYERSTGLFWYFDASNMKSYGIYEKGLAEWKKLIDKTK